VVVPVSHWHFFGYHMIRERRDGVAGVVCDRCQYWEPIIRRSDAEQASMTVTAPAHERYTVSKAPSKKLIRFGRKR
jgi:hypothetical protein